MSQHHDLLEDDGAGYLISVSDMMSGLLFIFIITLVAFIIHFQEAIQDQKQQKAELEQELAKLQLVTRQKEAFVNKLVGSNDVRAALLQALKEKLEALDILVDVDSEHGVLRLTEQAIRFQSAKDTLDTKNLRNLGLIGDVLSEVLPCYGDNPPTGDACQGKGPVKGQLDAVFLEGHTDNVPIIGSRHFQDNWDLSAQRAIRTFRLLVPPRPLLDSMLNTSGQPVFSVSGYGEGRPLEGHVYKRPTNDVSNRRIDLRFIMTPPSLTDVQQELLNQGAG